MRGYGGCKVGEHLRLGKNSAAGCGWVWVGVVGCPCSASIQETEEGGPWLPGQPGLCSKTLPPEHKPNQPKPKESLRLSMEEREEPIALGALISS